MDLLVKYLLITHVAAGFTSLGLFFIPMFARKGGRWHNWAGRWYVRGMWAVLITAVLLCGIRYSQGETVMSLFLGFLALLTSRPLYYGIAVLRNKRGPSARMQLVSDVLTVALAVGGPALIGFGLGWWGPGGHPLLIIFGTLGTVLALPKLFDRLRGKEKAYNWLHEHLSGMLVSAIAAFTAFLAFGGRSLFGEAFVGNLEVVFWVAPTVIGVAIIRWYKWKLGGAAKKSVIGLLLLCTFGTLDAQVYTEKQSRHRFAQLLLGVEQQQHLGGAAQWLDANGLINNGQLDGFRTTRLLIGGTHFWGHADFSIAFPIANNRMSFVDQEVQFTAGVETLLKYYPWRIEHNKIRPYVGTALTQYFYRQLHPNDVSQRGPGESFLTFPVKLGVNYSRGNHLFEVGASYNYAADRFYPITRETEADITLPRFSIGLSYRYMLETSLSAEKDWESGRTQLVTKELAERGKLNGFFLSIGPSSNFWSGNSSYNYNTRPFLSNYSTSILLEYGLGYYWHQPDINLAVTHRRMRSSASAFGVGQSITRRSIGLEATKYLLDFHGFAPFAGPVISWEQLTFRESDEGRLIHDLSDQRLTAGVTFGWDIRPNRVQTFLLRTNLRWYPALKLDISEQQRVDFGGIEFNFIQLVIFPGRLF
jgi:hypothetical protein